MAQAKIHPPMMPALLAGFRYVVTLILSHRKVTVALAENLMKRMPSSTNPHGQTWTTSLTTREEIMYKRKSTYSCPVGVEISVNSKSTVRILSSWVASREMEL